MPTPHDSVSIRVEHLTHIYASKPPVVANDDISFEVRRGEVFSLLGPNGAGKTTLISQLLGLLEPTSGSITLEGIEVARDPQQVKRITGYLPQSGIPMRYVEVERALRYTGCLRGQSERDAKQQAHALIEELELGEYAKRYSHNLSGGILRLTNFAMSLMGRLQVLILDEPTNELDPHKRRLVWDMIARLNREQGVTCILVTHNVLEAERVVQQVAVMQTGRIVALGTPGELKARSGSRVRLEFTLKDGEAFGSTDFDKLAGLGSIEALRPYQYRLYIQPQQVAAATDTMVNDIGLARLDDFRLAPPSLEDVYLALDAADTSQKER
jgi:ABC-2 type transport system permease protein